MPTIEEAQKFYPPSDGVHGFDHVLRVYHMAEKIGRAEDADIEILHAAALLHDAQGSHPAGGGRANHHEQSAEFAAEVLHKEGWSAEKIMQVQECIRGHRFRNTGKPPESLEARVLFDADKLEVLGAIGVARTIAYAMQAGQPHYAPVSDQFMKTGEKLPGEPHSAYHEYIFKLRNVKDRMFTATGKKIAEQRHQFLVVFFEQLKAEMEGEK